MIKFQEDGHIYTLDGKIIPSVTTKMKEAGLTSNFYKKGSAERGTMIHSLTEIVDLVPDFEPEEYQGYIKAWKAWKENANAKIIQSEMIVYSRSLWYAGTLDRIVEFNDELWILDIKTGAKAKWHPVQLAAYSTALAECTDYEVNQGVVCYIKANGTYSIDPVRGSRMEKAKEQWRGMV